MHQHNNEHTSINTMHQHNNEHTSINTYPSTLASSPSLDRKAEVRFVRTCRYDVDRCIATRASISREKMIIPYSLFVAYDGGVGVDDLGAQAWTPIVIDSGQEPG